MLLTVRVSPRLTAEESATVWLDCGASILVFAVQGFTAVAGNTADGNVERRRVVDGETTAAGGQGQLLGRRIAVAQSGRTINKFKARTDRQLQHVLAFIFLIGHHRRNFQQIQPPQRLFIFRQTGAAAELNTQRLAALGVNARNRRGDNKRGGNGIRCGIGIAVIQPGLRQRRTVGVI